MVSWGNLADRLEQWAASKYALFNQTFGRFGNKLPLAKHPENPVLEPGPTGAWDEGEAEPAKVLFGSDRRYWLYYYNHGAVGVNGSGLAYSDFDTPMCEWTKEADNPILEPGPSGAWDDEAALVQSVLVPSEGEWHMMYLGSDGEEWRAGHATSDDGIHWTKDDRNPVWDKYAIATVVNAGDKLIGYTHIGRNIVYLESSNWVDWEQKGVALRYSGTVGSESYNHVCQSCVHRARNGLYVMVYSAVEGVPGGGARRSISLALSNDGRKYVPYPGNPILTASLQGPTSKASGILMPSSFVDEKGRLNLIYHEDSTSGANLAVSSAKDVEGYFAGPNGWWNSSGIDAGDSTYGIPTLGYDSITIKFLSDTDGLLDVETQEPDLDWRTLLDDENISADTLKEINLGGLQRGIRLTFDTSATVTAFYRLQ